MFLDVPIQIQMFTFTLLMGVFGMSKLPARTEIGSIPLAFSGSTLPTVLNR